MSASSADLVADLEPARATHTTQVGVRAAQAALDVLEGAEARHVADLTTAALLHDAGYAWTTPHGLHAHAGAVGLRKRGYPDLVCWLVGTHTAAGWEAAQRGIDVAAMGECPVALETGLRLQAILTWADLTTSPVGEEVDVQTRVREILDRYVPGHPVYDYVWSHQDWMLAAGRHPLGLLDLPRDAALRGIGYPAHS